MRVASGRQIVRRLRGLGRSPRRRGDFAGCCASAMAERQPESIEAEPCPRRAHLPSRAAGRQRALAPCSRHSAYSSRRPIMSTVDKRYEVSFIGDEKYRRKWASLGVAADREARLIGDQSLWAFSGCPREESGSARLVRVPLPGGGLSEPGSLQAHAASASPLTFQVAVGPHRSRALYCLHLGPDSGPFRRSRGR